MMNRRELLGAVRSLARDHEAFLLSGMLAGAGTKGELRELRRTLEPHLGFLGLRGEERGDDFLVSRPLPAKNSVPSGEALDGLGAFLGTPSIPARLQDLIESFVGKTTGKAWNDPVVLERVRAAIRAQKGEYWDQGRGRPVSYRAGYRVLAYLAYQFPVVFVQVLHLIHDIAGDGLLRERMRVLDIGSGPGTVPLAITEAWGRLNPGKVRIFAVEQEAANIEAYRSLVPPFAAGNPAVEVAEPLQADIRALDPGDLPGEIDLVVFGNVLNELRDLSTGEKTAIVGQITRGLGPDGTVLLLEPADLENSVALRKLAHALGEQGLTVSAPCTPLWNTGCRPDRCWTFREEGPVIPTRLMDALAATGDGYRYRNTDIKFSYALLGKDGRTREGYRVLRGTKALRLSKLQGHLKRRVNVLAAKMSGDLGGGRGHLVYRVCDGTPQKPVFAVVPAHQAAHARALVEGGYGEILSLENVVVRFNPARDAFNLFVDRPARVEAAGRRTGRGAPPRGTGRSPGKNRPKGLRRSPEKD